MKKLILLFFILFLLCSGCKNQQKEAVKNTVSEFVGTQIVFPDSLQYRTLEDSAAHYSKKQLKIVVFINGECFSCLNQFIDWKKQADSLLCQGDVALLFYVKTVDFESIKKPMSDIGFHFPFFIDPKGDLLYINHIPQSKSLLHTFLLDRDNRVVLVGSPLNNPKLTELYKAEIKKLSPQD